MLNFFALTLFVLPLAVGEGWTPPAEGSPIPWLIGLMTVSLGLPFFALGASAPMLQMWVAHIRHPAAANPYVLHSSSILGSNLALFAYPVLAKRPAVLAPFGGNERWVPLAEDPELGV